MDAAGPNSGSLRLLGHIRGSWRPDVAGAVLGHFAAAAAGEERKGATRA